jgi:hypothetical protein
MTVTIASFALMLAAQNPYWHLPATIEALKDVEAVNSERHSDGSVYQERGVLYADEAFRIRKGERFQMVKVYGEGGCRIRFKNKEHDVSSCPWLEGFSDPQADIYRVISGHLSRRNGKRP